MQFESFFSLDSSRENARVDAQDLEKTVAVVEGADAAGSVPVAKASEVAAKTYDLGTGVGSTDEFTT
jgi:hypothetical protein